MVVVVENDTSCPILEAEANLPIDRNKDYHNHHKEMAIMTMNSYSILPNHLPVHESTVPIEGRDPPVDDESPKSHCTLPLLLV